MIPEGGALIPESPAAASDVIRQQANTQDYVVLRLAVVGLTTASLTSVIGAVVLAFQGQTAPDGVVAIGSAGVGALATLLVRPNPPPSVTNIIDRRRPQEGAP